MYRTMESVELLTELGENKESIIKLLEELAELGWTQSHWVKYKDSNSIPFIEIYGDGSYKHIEGKTIEEAYEKALKAIKALKVCQHEWKYRVDAFKICEKCAQFGRASLEEMKERFTEFSMKTKEGNKRFFAGHTLCDVCNAKEIIEFGLSFNDDYGYYCDNCKTVHRKRGSSKEHSYGFAASPIDPEFAKKLPPTKLDRVVDITLMRTMGVINENGLKRNLEKAVKLLKESVDSTERVVDPNYEITEDRLKSYLKRFVLEGNPRYEQNGEQYRIKDIELSVQGCVMKDVELTLEKMEKKAPTTEKMLSSIIQELAKQAKKERED